MGIIVSFCFFLFQFSSYGTLNLKQWGLHLLPVGFLQQWCWGVFDWVEVLIFPIAKVRLLASIVWLFKQCQYGNCSLAKNMQEGISDWGLPVLCYCFVLCVQKDLSRAHHFLKWMNTHSLYYYSFLSVSNLFDKNN